MTCANSSVRRHPGAKKQDKIVWAPLMYTI